MNVGTDARKPVLGGTPMNAGYESTIVADEFLQLASKSNDTLTPMQLLKLVYLAHGWMLGIYGVPLIRESIEAWRYGPVIPDLYHKVKKFRDQPVDRSALSSGQQVESLGEREKKLIEDVYKKYGKLSGIQLSMLTHKKGSPWDQCYEDGKRNIRISNDIIEDYFGRLFQEYVRQVQEERDGGCLREAGK